MRRHLLHPYARTAMALTPSQRDAHMSRAIVWATLVAGAFLGGTLVVTKWAGG